MNNNENILKALEELRDGQKRVESRLDGIDQRIGTIEEDQLHVSTALDTLKAWQDDIREKMVTKADFTHLEEKVDATKAEVDTIKKQLRPRHAD